jgi:crotonobetainyl-CoA:carnitine CoA-transferase CaiB-like acyl-CoA transferase
VWFVQQGKSRELISPYQLATDQACLARRCGERRDEILVCADIVDNHQEAEVTFKFAPGQIYTGKVESVLQAIATGQTQVSGTAVVPKEVEAAPFVARVKLDDAGVARKLPAGATGTAAIYTDHLKPTHVVRRVILRQIAIVNYVNPF